MTKSECVAKARGYYEAKRHYDEAEFVEQLMLDGYTAEDAKAVVQSTRAARDAEFERTLADAIDNLIAQADRAPRATVH